MRDIQERQRDKLYDRRAGPPGPGSGSGAGDDSDGDDVDDGLAVLSAAVMTIFYLAMYCLQLLVDLLPGKWSIP